MSMQLLLAVAIHGIVIAVALWDLFVMMAGRNDDTVSLVTRQWADGHPVFPLIVGMVLGHLFWSNCPTVKAAEKKTEEALVVKCQLP